MKDQHLTLIVEDDKDFAGVVGTALEGMNHKTDWVTNAQDGLERLERGGVCSMLCDLEIFAHPKAAAPIVESGFKLCEEAHRRFPHLLIFAMSGRANSKEDMVRLVELKAVDSFIDKPFARGRGGAQEVIERCFLKAGREKHARCLSIFAEMRAASAGESAAPKIDIFIGGAVDGLRTPIRVNDMEGDIPPKPLFTTLTLYAGRLLDREGFVRKGKIGNCVINQRDVSSVRQALRHYCGKGEIVDPDNRQGYRLNPRIRVEVDLESLRSHPDKKVKDIVALIDKIHKEDAEARDQ